MKPSTDNPEIQSHWRTVLFTFSLFSLFCLGIGVLCHQNHGAKVAGVVAFYFTRRKFKGNNGVARGPLLAGDFLAFLLFVLH